MNILMDGSAVLLQPGQWLALRDAAGAVAEVKRGSVWITLENDRRDVFLRRGERWTIDRDGLTLVQAEEATTVMLCEPRRPRGAASFVDRIVGAWQRLAPPRLRAPLPYY